MKSFKYINGQVGPLLRIANASFNRPADVIAYAQYDIVAPVTSGYTGTQLKLINVPSGSQEWLRGVITSVRIMTTNPDITTVSFRVNFFNISKNAGSDNSEYGTGNWVDHYFNNQGLVDVTLDQTDGTRAWGLTTGKRIPFETLDSLYVHIQSLKSPTYTPLSAQKFFIEVTTECDH